MFDYDVVIVGSGFGGSVSALRLAEAGLKVAILEQGRRPTSEDLERAGDNPNALAWLPALKRYGVLSQDLFRHVGIVRGIGVGGGSLVYAAVLLEPKTAFYQDPTWKNLSSDWQTELAPHYHTAKYMLGVNENPYQDIQDDWLQKTANIMGAAESYDVVPQGIFFGNPNKDVEDPILDNQGPKRRGCNLCGRCITGCAQGAKNSLDKNYLYLAEQKGVKIFAETKVTHLEQLAATPKGYRIHTVHPWKKNQASVIKAKHVILSAGVIGTLEVLFASRDHYQTLPNISQALGEHIRTNSKAIVTVVSNDPTTDVTHGTTISSHFYADDKTHITQNRFPASYNFMRFYMGPMVNDAKPLSRSLKTIKELIFHPVKSTKGWRGSDWFKQVSVLTVMQQADNELRFTYGRSLFKLGRLGLKSQLAKGERAPSYIPQANQAAQVFAEVSNGIAQNVLLESVGNLSITAHILGGAVMAEKPEDGVIDKYHQVFGYEGLYVMDGSAIPVNVGVNPSLTITALAERFAAEYLKQHLLQVPYHIGIQPIVA